MPIPQVETFESDITEEIRQKQGSVTDVLAAHSNTPSKTPDQNIIRSITFVIIFLLASLGTGIWYYLSIGKENIAEREALKKPIITPKPQVSITKLLPKTGSNIERFVVSTKKENAGYVITINDYASVYGNLLANETTFGKELITLFSVGTISSPVFKDVTINNQDMRIAMLVILSTSTQAVTSTKEVTPVVPPPAPTLVAKPVATTTVKSAAATSSKTTSATTTKTTTSTSTIKTSSASTKATTTKEIPIESATTSQPVVVTPEEVFDPLASYDYISYGFIGTSTLLISTSKEKLLELRSGIIK